MTWAELEEAAMGLPRMTFGPPREPEDWLSREWLLTNGRGGFASGTLAMCNARRYHGLFIPSLPGLGRQVLLARLRETVEVEGQSFRLDAEEHPQGQELEALAGVRGFVMRGLMPEWEYAVGPVRLRRRLLMVHGEDTLFVVHEQLSGPACSLRLRPFPAFRSLEAALMETAPEAIVKLHGHRLELQATEDAPVMRIGASLHSSAQGPVTPCTFVGRPESNEPAFLRVEKARGYDSVEAQASPGEWRASLSPGGFVVLAVTTDDWARIECEPVGAFLAEVKREKQLLAQAPNAARAGMAGRLTLAADSFVIEPLPRPSVDPRTLASNHARSIIAGYHWFTDWGRDTMISLEGLTLSTGRPGEAAAILRTFARYVRDGLIPNYFPDGENEGVYHTADATLWYFHALSRYLETTGDAALLAELFPVLEGIIAQHLAGTRFGIGVDPRDGLLRQGAEGYQLTWMDAKVGDWVVTPRRGKAVEINALWFNALSLMRQWATTLGKPADVYATWASRAEASFNARFWNPNLGCLFDVVDTEQGGDDASVRPNQVFAISLPHPILRAEYWQSVMDTVERELLTPVGLRTLSPDHPDFKRTYDGDLRSRDAAYHQGTVWAWLLGPYADAALKLKKDAAQVRALFKGLEGHLEAAGLGQISEIFDATEPFRPRGCIAQAWSVAETLRSLSRKDAEQPG